MSARRAPCHQVSGPEVGPYVLELGHEEVSTYEQGSGRHSGDLAPGIDESIFLGQKSCLEINERAEGPPLASRPLRFQESRFDSLIP